MNVDGTRNVLFVSQAFEGHLTGWAKHTSKLLDALGDQGGSLQFSLLTSQGETSEALQSIVSDAKETPFAYGEETIRKAVSGLAIVFYFLRSYRKWNLVYCSNFYFPIPLLVLLARALGCKAIVRIAGQEVTATGWRGMLRDIASRQADGIVVLNRAVQQYLLDQDVSDQAIHLIPNAVDTTVYAPKDSEGDRPAAVSHLLCVAAVCERKGIHHLIRAMDRLRDHSETTDLHLTVVGPFNEGESTSAYTKQLVALIRRQGLEGKVKFTGRVENVVSYYQEADVFLLPSYREGMPNVLLEAMACRLPCIASTIPGVVDVVEDGETALLVQPGSEEELADALKRLLHDKELVVRLRHNARQYVEEHHSLKNMASAYREVIESTL